jgi:hypothetical protein
VNNMPRFCATPSFNLCALILGRPQFRIKPHTVTSATASIRGAAGASTHEVSGHGATIAAAAIARDSAPSSLNTNVAANNNNSPIVAGGMGARLRVNAAVAAVSGGNTSPMNGGMVRTGSSSPLHRTTPNNTPYNNNNNGANGLGAMVAAATMTPSVANHLPSSPLGSPTGDHDGAQSTRGSIGGGVDAAPVMTPTTNDGHSHHPSIGGPATPGRTGSSHALVSPPTPSTHSPHDAVVAIR